MTKRSSDANDRNDPDVQVRAEDDFERQPEGRATRQDRMVMRAGAKALTPLQMRASDA